MIEFMLLSLLNARTATYEALLDAVVDEYRATDPDFDQTDEWAADPHHPLLRKMTELHTLWHYGCLASFEADCGIVWSGLLDDLLDAGHFLQPAACRALHTRLIASNTTVNIDNLLRLLQRAVRLNEAVVVNGY